MCSSNGSSSCLMQMLTEIIRNDQKPQDGYVSVAPIAFWTQTFAKYFLHVDNPHHDDLLFYVKKSEYDDEPEVQVFRRESAKSPGLGDPSYDWTETVYLNMLLQQLEYTLTCAICTKVSSPKENVIIHKRVSQQVYASPSKHSMEEKDKSAQMCYPNIFFTIDSFDEVWTDLTLNDGEMVCVEIVATDKSKMFSSVIFLGSVNYQALTKVYDKRTLAASKWMQVMSLGLLKNINNVEFVRMKGPNSKGYAEMAIQRITAASTSSVPVLDQLSRSSDSRNSSRTTTQSADVLSSSSSDSSLTNSNSFKSASKKKVKEGSFPQGHSSTQSLPSSPSKSRASRTVKDCTALKPHLTYVTLPWHRIILDVLQSYENPSSSRKPVLLRKPISNK